MSGIDLKLPRYDKRDDLGVVESSDSSSQNRLKRARPIKGLKQGVLDHFPLNSLLLLSNLNIQEEI